MVDYSKSKIYKIEPINSEDEGDVYIGSTTKDTLAQRMTKHRCDYKYWKIVNNQKTYKCSYNLFEKYGLENCSIFLIEQFSCKSKDELRTREGFYIKTIKCINKNIAGRTSKEYYIDNKDKIIAYHESIKDRINLNRKALYDSRKEQKFNCCCGGCFNYYNKKRHLTSNKHKNFLSN